MGGLAIIMYSKKIYLKEEAVKKSVIDNSPVSKEVIDQLRGLYSAMEYNAATKYLFGEPHIIVTGLTTHRANMLIAHAKFLSIATKKKKEKDITPNRSIKPYRNIWNTLEKCKR